MNASKKVFERGYKHLDEAYNTCIRLYNNTLNKVDNVEKVRKIEQICEIINETKTYLNKYAGCFALPILVPLPDLLNDLDRVYNEQFRQIDEVANNEGYCKAYDICGMTSTHTLPVIYTRKLRELAEKIEKITGKTCGTEDIYKYDSVPLHEALKIVASCIKTVEEAVKS